MPQQITAGETQDVQFDGKQFVPADKAVEGPVFTIRALDYFTALEAQGKDSEVETARVAIAAGVVAIDGDKGKASKFAAAPRASLGTPIFNAVWGLTWGNSPAPEASE